MTALTGRDLDLTVAEAMGYRWWNYHNPAKPSEPDRCYKFIRWPEWKAEDEYSELGVPNVRPAPADMLPFRDAMRDVPKFSAPDCSGLAPVLEWLTENGPDGINLELVYDGYGWRAGYWDAHKMEWVCVHDTDDGTLPEAACRLLVAWAGRKT